MQCNSVYPYYLPWRCLSRTMHSLVPSWPAWLLSLGATVVLIERASIWIEWASSKKDGNACIQLLLTWSHGLTWCLPFFSTLAPLLPRCLTSHRNWVPLSWKLEGRGNEMGEVWVGKVAMQSWPNYLHCLELLHGCLCFLPSYDAVVDLARIRSWDRCADIDAAVVVLLLHLPLPWLFPFVLLLKMYITIV